MKSTASRIQNEKKVPFEQLDHTIYKNTNLVVFSTSEKRLPIWIDVLKRRYIYDLECNNRVTTRYEKTDNLNEKSKCEKIVLSLTSKASLENIITITITITIGTGRIKIEGHSIKEWEKHEFALLIELINCSDLDKMDATNDTTQFFDAVFQKHPCNSSSTKDHKSPEVTPTGEKFLLAMKSSISTLEADFVEFAQNTKKEIQNLTETLTKKDQEIELLRNDLNRTKTKSQQSFSDLTKQQMEMETKFKNLQEKYKILADKNTNLLCQISALRDDSLQPTKPPVNTNKTTDEPKEEVDLTDDTNSIMESYNIPTANKFENLTKQDKPTNENQQIKTNKDQTAKDEPTSGIQQPNGIRNNTSNDADTIILCDSNGRHINTKLLCPDSNVKDIRCPTLPQAEKIINNSTDRPPPQKKNADTSLWNK